MYYDKIRHRHSQVLAATGLTPVEFEALLITFKHHWDEYYSHFTLEGKVRQRISYNRKTSVLPLIQDKMFFILVYLKTNPLQENDPTSSQQVDSPSFGDSTAHIKDTR